MAVICTENSQLFHILWQVVPELQPNVPRPSPDYCETKGNGFVPSLRSRVLHLDCDFIERIRSNRVWRFLLALFGWFVVSSRVEWLLLAAE
jgi:hypothetical protein